MTLRCRPIYPASQKTGQPYSWPIAFLDVDRFSIFFQQLSQQSTSNDAITKDHITPKTRRYTTL